MIKHYFVKQHLIREYKQSAISVGLCFIPFCTHINNIAPPPKLKKVLRKLCSSSFSVEICLFKFDTYLDNINFMIKTRSLKYIIPQFTTKIKRFGKKNKRTYIHNI